MCIVLSYTLQSTVGGTFYVDCLNFDLYWTHNNGSWHHEHYLISLHRIVNAKFHKKKEAFIHFTIEKWRLLISQFFGIFYHIFKQIGYTGMGQRGGNESTFFFFITPIQNITKHIISDLLGSIILFAILIIGIVLNEPYGIGLKQMSILVEPGEFARAYACSIWYSHIRILFCHVLFRLKQPKNGHSRHPLTPIQAICQW